MGYMRETIHPELDLAHRQQETSLSQAQQQADLRCHLSKPFPWGPAITSPVRPKVMGSHWGT